MDLKPYTGTSAVPSREEPKDRLEATSPPRNMAIGDAGTKEQRWPGGPWWGGRPGGTPVLCGLVWVTTGSVLLGVALGQAEFRRREAASVMAGANGCVLFS